MEDFMFWLDLNKNIIIWFEKWIYASNFGHMLKLLEGFEK